MTKLMKKSWLLLVILSSSYSTYICAEDSSDVAREEVHHANSRRMHDAGRDNYNNAAHRNNVIPVNANQQPAETQPIIIQQPTNPPSPPQC